MRASLLRFAISWFVAVSLHWDADDAEDRMCEEFEATNKDQPSGTMSLLQHQRNIPGNTNEDIASPIGSDIGIAKVIGVAGARESHFRDALWIHAFSRSGSSVVLSMIRNTEADVFTLYEPCHEGDELAPDLAAQGCLALLRNVAQCNFSGVDKLWGWESNHTTNGGSAYSKELASRLCNRAKLVVWKTIDYTGNMQNIALEELRANPRLRIISIVRDPRSIYASRQITPGVFPGRSRIKSMLEICDSLAASSNISHARFSQLVYEDLVTNTTLVARRIQAFLHREFTEKHEKWIRSNFNARNCGSTWKPYSVCRTNATGSRFKYRETLTNNEYAAFMAHRECRMVSETYGYDPFDFQADVLEHDPNNWLESTWFGILSCVVASVFAMAVFFLCFGEFQQVRKGSEAK